MLVVCDPVTVWERGYMEVWRALGMVVTDAACSCLPIGGRRRRRAAGNSCMVVRLEQVCGCEPRGWMVDSAGMICARDSRIIMGGK